jgi:PAS domain S-box-containing protein
LTASQSTKVLIVDDVDLVVEMVQGLLEQLGYEVIGVAADGLEAVDLAARLHPDVIVMDIGLPRLNGLEAARRIKKDCPTPIVVLTPYDDPDLVAQAGAAGVGAYVLKPSNARELDRAITISRARFEDLRALQRLNTALECEVTERKRAERALRESEARFRAIFESAQDFIFIKDRDLRYIQVNPAMERLFGATAEELIGKTDEDLFGAEVGAEVMAMDRQVLRGQVISQEHAKPVQGVAHTFHVIKVPMRDSAGEIVGLCGIARDITARKRMEEELRRSQKDLQEFAYSISHDLQSPLRMVTGFLRLLESSLAQQPGEDNACQFDDQARQYIAYAMEGAERMCEMIRGLLEYSRVGTRGRELGPTDCEEVLAHVLVDVMVPVEKGSEAPEADAVITHDPLPTVLADEVQLGQVFQNLIGNAVKFRGDVPPQVHISACEDGEQWRFAVQDNGIGIDPAQADRLFRVFERLHTEEEYPGTGIGLAICKKIVERHGGRIWLDSEPGNGSTFYFTLPKVDNCVH